MILVVWTDSAIKDLEEIENYIALDSAKYASETISILIYRADILINHPLTGKIVPEKNDKTIRELIEGNYRIVYKVVSEYEIHILAVYHGARDMSKRNL